MSKNKSISEKSKLFEYFFNKLDINLCPWIVKEIKTEDDLISYYENNMFVQSKNDIDRD